MLTPKYFDKFTCIAGDCPDSCCRAGWQITIDDAAYKAFSAIDGRLGDKFRESVTLLPDGDRVFSLDDNGVCPFLDCNGLCELYIATGGVMTEICGAYPRFTEEFDGFTERGISISCPEAERLILSAETSDYPTEAIHTDDDILALLYKFRTNAFSLLQASSEPLVALKQLLLDAIALQNTIDDDDCIEYRDAAVEPYCLLSSMCDCILDSTDILVEEWCKALERQSFTVKAIEPSVKKAYLSYLIFRYCLKAINRVDILSQVELIALLYLLPLCLEGDFAALCRYAAKETEHDAENADALLDAIYDCDYFTAQDIINAINALLDSE